VDGRRKVPGTVPGTESGTDPGAEPGTVPGTVPGTSVASCLLAQSGDESAAKA